MLQSVLWETGDRVCMGGITQEREGAEVPTEPWRRNDKENESFSKDIRRENRKVESDPRED